MRKVSQEEEKTKWVLVGASGCSWVVSVDEEGLILPSKLLRSHVERTSECIPWQLPPSVKSFLVGPGLLPLGTVPV